MQGETFIFFGVAGSGKGTQVKLLQEFLKSHDGKDMVYVYPGNEYRKLTESENYTGSLVKEAMHRGELLPGFLTDAIVVNILISSLTFEKHLIADGYPRQAEQSINLEKIMNFYSRKDIKIIYLELSKEEAIKRNLLRGRVDDTNEGMEKRFEEFVNKVVPAMDYFKGKDGYTIYTINGDQSIEVVHKDIISALGL